MSELYLICDTSGSMVEGGKRFILRNVVRTVDQYYRLHKSQPAIKLVSWADIATVLSWEAGQDIPDAFLHCSSAVSGAALVECLQEADNAYFALVSDGYWPAATRKEVGVWSKSLAADHLRIIKIGEDADPRLKGPSVFAAEDLLAALKGWIE